MSRLIFYNRQHPLKINWLPLAERLKNIDVGESVSFVRPAHLKRPSSDVQQALARNGVNAAVDVKRNRVKVTKKSVDDPRYEQTQKIVGFISLGYRNTEIARRFGLSQQRVQQIKALYFNSLPTKERRRSLLLWMKPYLDNFSKIECPLCSEEMATGGARSKEICTRCRTIISNINAVKAALHRWVASADDWGLFRAAHLIRKHSVSAASLKSLRCAKPTQI